MRRLALSSFIFQITFIDASVQQRIGPGPGVGPVNLLLIGPGPAPGPSVHGPVLAQDFMPKILFFRRKLKNPEFFNEKL